MFLALAVLIPVNYALQGYETIITYERDPNTTSVLWYHIFTGKPKPGSQCNDHIFSLGDTFQTSTGTLSYTIQSIRYNSSDAMNSWGGTTIPYKDLSTDFCDVTYIGLVLNVPVGSLVQMAKIQCIHEDFQVNATTSVNMSDVTDADPLWYLIVASLDVLLPLWMTGHQIASGLVSSVDGATISASGWLTWFCPMFLIKNETDINGGALGPQTTHFPFCTPQQYDQPAFNSSIPYVEIKASGKSSDFGLAFQNAMENYLETFALVVRYDLGSRLPSNFLVNPSGVLSQNQIFLPVGPGVVGNLTTTIQQAIGVSLPLAEPFNASAPNQPAAPTLSTTYECHLTIRKGAGSAAVSIIVATITIGRAIWGLLMLAVGYIAEGNEPGADHDKRGSLEEGIPNSLNASEEHLELQERSDLQLNTSHGRFQEDE